MRDDLAADIEMYAGMVENLPLYDEYLEVTNLLCWRDAIQRSRDAGARLSPEATSELERADQQWLKLRRKIARRFPVVFEDRGAPAEYWWWHLDRGPQVRASALAAAEES